MSEKSKSTDMAQFDHIRSPGRQVPESRHKILGRTHHGGQVGQPDEAWHCLISLTCASGPYHADGTWWAHISHITYLVSLQLNLLMLYGPALLDIIQKYIMNMQDRVGTIGNDMGIPAMRVQVLWVYLQVYTKITGRRRVTKTRCWWTDLGVDWTAIHSQTRFDSWHLQWSLSGR